MVAEAGNGRAAVALARRLQPDVVLLDARLPLLDGVRATAQMVGANPEVRVIILALHQQAGDLFEAIRAGARGYLLKDVSPQALVEAVRAVYRGEAVLDGRSTAELFDEFRALAGGQRG